MGVVDTLFRIRPPRVADTVRLAEALRTDPTAGLAQLARWLESPEHRDAPAETRLAALEAMRAEWRGAAEPMLAALRNRPIPLDTDELASLHRAGHALRALRDAHLSIHDGLRGPAADAPPTPRALLALARALDAQSRLLVAACRLRVALPREDWDTVCRLAFPLWTASALDETYPHPSSASRGETARAAFATPLLLRLLEPLGLPAAQLDLAAALARRAARRTGVRIDVDGLPHVCAEGPALLLSAQHGVRLDTRAGLERLSRVRARLAQGDGPASLGLRTPLSAAAVDELLVLLATVWGPCHVPTPLARAPLPTALMHVGLPRRTRAGQGRPAPTAESGAAPPTAGAPAPSPYVYRRASAVVLSGRELRAGPTDTELAGMRDDAVRTTMDAIASPVEWRGQDARRAVFARTDPAPRLRLGQLVAVLPVRAFDLPTRRAMSHPTGLAMPLRLGRVATLAQTGVVDGRKPFAHDVGVAFWPGATVPVRVRLEGASAFEDAWWTPAGPDDATSTLTMRRDRFESPCDVVVRETSRDVELRLRRLLERGPDFDRVEVGPIG
jgi:hypothetical protein